MAREYSFYNSVAYENAEQIKTTPGRLLRFFGYNSLGSAQWIQVHNAITTPADTAVPIISIAVAASSNFDWDCEWLQAAWYFSNGIYICNSTTGPTKTLGAADCWFNVIYA